MVIICLHSQQKYQIFPLNLLSQIIVVVATYLIHENICIVHITQLAKLLGDDSRNAAKDYLNSCSSIYLCSLSVLMWRSRKCHYRTSKVNHFLACRTSMRQEKQTTKQNPTSTESHKIEKDEFACNKCKPNYNFALRSGTKYSAVLFLGGKKKRGLPTRRTCPFPQKTPFQFTCKNGLTAV